MSSETHAQQNPRWSDQERTQLLACWKRGMTAGEISREIPTKTRSAILGKLKRLRDDERVTDKPAKRA